MKDIVVNFLNVFLDAINSIFVGLIQILFGGFLDGSLSPSIDKLNEILNGNVVTIMEYFSWLGGILLIVFFVVRMVAMLMFGTLGTEAKSTVQSLFLRLTFCFIALFFTINFGNWVLDTGMKAYNKGIEFFGEQNTVDGSISSDYGKLGENSVEDSIVSLEEDFQDTGNKEKVFGVAIVLVSDYLIPILCIIRIVVLIICGYNLIKLIAELASRYVMMMVLYMGLPASVPFYVSIETEQVFFTYLKMFATETAILVLTQIWISISFYMYSHMASSMIAIFLFIAWTRIGVRLEQLLKDLGLSTTSMGGSLFNEVALATGVLAMGISRLGHTVGSTALNIGALTNNMKLGQVGAGLLGKGVGVESVANAMANSAGGALRASMDYKGLNPLAKAMMSGVEARMLPSILNSAGKNGKLAMTEGALNSVYGNVRNTDALKNSGYKISSTGTIGKNGMGVTLNNGSETLQGIISDRKGGKGMTSIPFNDAMGNQMYLNIANSGATNFTAGELALGTPDGQAHVANMVDGLGETTVVNSGDNQTEYTKYADYAINDDGTASVYEYMADNDGNTLDGSSKFVGLVTTQGQELFAPKNDFSNADRQVSTYNSKTGENETVNLREEVGNDTGAIEKFNIASMFSTDDSSICYNGQAYKPDSGSAQFANIVKSSNIKLDSIAYSRKTGNFEFDTYDGRHFKFDNACHSYATHSGKIVGNNDTGHYFVNESKIKEPEHDNKRQNGNARRRR